MIRRVIALVLVLAALLCSHVTAQSTRDARGISQSDLASTGITFGGPCTWIGGPITVLENGDQWVCVGGAWALRDYVSISARDFGALADGSDDSVAIQAMVDAGFDSLGPGTFSIASSIELGANEGLIGRDEGATTIRALAGLSGSPVIKDDLDATAETGMYVRNLTIDGNGANALHGIVFNTDTDVLIDSVTITDVDQSGVLLAGDGARAQIRRLTVTDALQGSASGGYEGALDISWDESIVTHCDVGGADAAMTDGGNRCGLLLTGTQRVHVSDCVFRDAETGFYLEDDGAADVPRGNVLSSVTTTNNQGHGFHITSITDTLEIPHGNLLMGCASVYDAQAAADTYSGFLMGRGDNHVVGGYALPDGTNDYEYALKYEGTDVQIAYVWGFIYGAVGDYTDAEPFFDTGNAGGLQGVHKNRQAELQLRGPNVVLGRNRDERLCYEFDDSDTGNMELCYDEPEIRFELGEDNIQAWDGSGYQSVVVLQDKGAAPSASGNNLDRIWRRFSGGYECMYFNVADDGATDMWVSTVCGKRRMGVLDDHIDP